MSQGKEQDWFAVQVQSAKKNVGAWPAQFRGKDAIASARLPATPEISTRIAAGTLQSDFRKSK